MVAQKPYVLSVGIDIEKSSRKVNPGTHKFFINSEDGEQLDPLQIWVLKEASFKALFPLRVQLGYTKTWTLNDFWVNSNLFGIKGNRFAIGQVKIFSFQGLIGAYALIK